LLFGAPGVSNSSDQTKDIPTETEMSIDFEIAAKQMLD
jgi:hypothetical protein